MNPRPFHPHSRARARGRACRRASPFPSSPAVIGVSLPPASSARLVLSSLATHRVPASPRGSILDSSPPPSHPPLAGERGWAIARSSSVSLCVAPLAPRNRPSPRRNHGSRGVHSPPFSRRDKQFDALLVNKVTITRSRRRSPFFSGTGGRAHTLLGAPILKFYSFATRKRATLGCPSSFGICISVLPRSTFIPPRLVFLLARSLPLLLPLSALVSLASRSQPPGRFSFYLRVMHFFVGDVCTAEGRGRWKCRNERTPC